MVFNDLEGIKSNREHNKLKMDRKTIMVLKKNKTKKGVQYEMRDLILLKIAPIKGIVSIGILGKFNHPFIESFEGNINQ